MMTIHLWWPLTFKGVLSLGIRILWFLKVEKYIMSLNFNYLDDNNKSRMHSILNTLFFSQFFDNL